MKDLSLYLHIPYCVKKCLYCDFLSFPAAGQGCGMDEYTDLLCREIELSAAEYKEYQVLSIFFGGGTPTLLPQGAVAEIMETIRRNYRVAEDAEITMEMNPETARKEKIKEYITCGINRMSIGLQSTEDEELERIGRIHDYRTFLEAYDLVRNAGFRSVNIDLMAALPGQSVESYRRTLERAVRLKPEHISAYSLILEEGTPLYERRAAYAFPSEEEDRAMYELTGDLLASCGYHRYEISNYALEGFECRHNKVYWQRGNYAGFGLGASSMVENVRWTNPADMETYRLYAPDRHPLTLHEQMEEYMFLGLRMMRGVDVRRFADEFGAPMDTVYGGIIDKMCGLGLLEREDGAVRLTGRGIDISNYVMAQFLFDETE